MSPIYYLISHYGGYLSLNITKGNFVISENFNESVCAVVYHKDKLYLLINDQLKEFYVDGKNIRIQNYGVFLRLSLGKNLLSTMENKNIVLLNEDAFINFQTNFLLSIKQNVYSGDILFKKELLSFPTSSRLYEIPKKIWIYWEQYEVPDIVKTCYSRLKKINPDFQIHFLNKESIFNYLPRDFTTSLFSSSISVTLRSDIIRLELLYLYGGVWVDSSIIFNEPIENILTEGLSSKYQIVTFYIEQHLPKNCPNAKFPIFENWFIASEKNSEFIKIWREYLRKILYIGLDNLYKEITENQYYPQITRNFDEKYHIAYLTQQLSLIELEQKNALPALLAYKANHSAFYYQNQGHYYHYWGAPSNFIELATLPRERLLYLPKLIKLTSHDRKMLDKLKDVDMCLPCSYLYPILYPNKDKQ